MTLGILWSLFQIKKRISRKGLRMMTDEKIKNSSELEFAVFCIENVAAKLGVAFMSRSILIPKSGWISF